MAIKSSNFIKHYGQTLVPFMVFSRPVAGGGMIFWPNIMPAAVTALATAVGVALLSGTVMSGIPGGGFLGDL